MKNKIAEYGGWLGMTAILVSFALISFGVITAQNILYQVLNLTGAIGVAWNAYEQKAHPSVMLNVIYGLVALIALIQILF
jgi:hypothetical protein